jgi:oligopeptide/dipeptide ABC transporter ATP-binding protein
MSDQRPLLEIDGLDIRFGGSDAPQTVEDLSFHINPRETLCLVGESGSGKSISAMSLLGLLPETAHVTARRLSFDGREIDTTDSAAVKRLRGQGIAMIFQDPMTSLNPAFTIGYQMIETIRLAPGIDRKAARAKAIEYLELVRIPDAPRRMESYPHQLSGGMRQRVMIAMALSRNPKLLIADEPTTALDVTIQAQILGLIDDLKDTLDTAVLFITHDLGVVAETADRVAVMYAGRLVEAGPVAAIFDDPRHAYTVGLMQASPRVNVSQRRLQDIPGAVPDVHTRPPGCSFAPRCAYALEACREPGAATPHTEGGHMSRCVRSGELRILTEAVNG